MRVRERPALHAADAATDSLSGDVASKSASSRRWQPPHPPPAVQRSVISETVVAPDAIAASTVRSFTALQ